jgi:hypothetical protein
VVHQGQLHEPIEHEPSNASAMMDTVQLWKYSEDMFAAMEELKRDGLSSQPTGRMRREQTEIQGRQLGEQGPISDIIHTTNIENVIGLPRTDEADEDNECFGFGVPITEGEDSARKLPKLCMGRGASATGPRQGGAPDDSSP